MGDILDSDDYPEIRAAIDVGIGRNDLTDEVIGQSIFLDAGEKDVLLADPLALTRLGDDAERIRRAAIYFVAARLAGSVVRITSTSIQTRDLNYSRRTFDPDEKERELRARAHEQLSAILEPQSKTSASFTMFSTAAGRRGKYANNT